VVTLSMTACSAVKRRVASIIISLGLNDLNLQGAEHSEWPRLIQNGVQGNKLPRQIRSNGRIQRFSAGEIQIMITGECDTYDSMIILR